jgi:diguanylate cyclase (GGDEF)-like protein
VTQKVPTIAEQAAKIAGLRSFETPTLEAVEHRRLQLWVITLLLLVTVAVAFVLIAALPQEVPAAFLTPRVLQFGLLGLVLLFCAYALEKELQLRRLTALLVKERVLTTALVNRVRELASMLAAAKAVNLFLDLEDVLETILNSAVELLEGRSGSIMLARGDELRTVCSLGDGPARGARVPFGAGIAGQVAATAEPLLINGVLADDARLTPYVPGHPVPTSSMTIPLIHRGAVLGVLNLGAQETRTYNEYDLRALSLFGEQAAGAIANAQLYEEQKLLASQNLYQALHDPLTSLPNRGLFLDRVEHSLMRRRPAAVKAALLFLDLDEFKTVNDTLGHAAGDEVLVAVGGRLRTCIRAGDTVARFGGDEFAILLEDIVSPSDPLLMAERIVSSLREPFAVGGWSGRLGASIGIAIEEVGTAVDVLLRQADIAMNAAKARGKAQIVVFDQGLDRETGYRLDLESELLLAVEQDRLTLEFQPIVSLLDGRIGGLEVFVRWQHPQRGTLPAVSFVHLAERSGVLAQVDRQVFRQACRTVSSLVTDGTLPPRVSVHLNVSARRLSEPNLVQEITEDLEAFGLAANRFVVEITEHAVLANASVTASRLSALKTLGMRVALDDFGTGYSSLTHVRHLPVDALKIDTVLIAGLAKESGVVALVQAILKLGQGLSLEVIAEGIEQEAQLASLRELGCRVGQGFLFAAPMSGNAVREWLRAHRGRSDA